MSKNLFTLSAAMLLILLTGLAFSGLSWRPSAAMNTGAAPVPLLGGDALSDYYQRHQNLPPITGMTTDLSDYFLRHPEAIPSMTLIDRSDYFLRH